MKELKIIYGEDAKLPKLLGLGYEVVPLSEWHHEPNTNYFCVGPDCYDRIREEVPLGLRGASFQQVAMMNRVGLNDGSNYTFTWATEWDVANKIEVVKNPDFEKVNSIVKEVPEEIITDVDRAIEVFNELNDLPLDTWYGYDYESAGFPNDCDFIVTGLGLATLEKRYFIDFRFCMTVPRPYLISYDDHEDEGLKKLNDAHYKFLQNHSRKVIVFNTSFELIATYRYLGEFFDYRDLNVTNIMKQFGTWCNLKWTVRYLLNTNSWDDEFESFNEAFNEDPSASELPVCEKDEEGNIISINYANIRKRFSWISLSDCVEIQKHFEVRKNSFYIMPSRWLGHYCSLDAYYTLLGWVSELPNWNYNDDGNNHYDQGERLDKLDRFPIEDRFNIMAEAGLDVYSDGKIAEAIVNSGGQLLDSKWWRFGLNLCDKYLLFTTTYLSMFYFKYKYEHLTDRNDINDYSPTAQKFIEEGIDITLEGYYLSKTLLMERYYDENYDGCCNTNMIYEDWGEEVGQEIIDTIWEFCDTLEGASRKRKLFQEVGAVIDEHLKLSKELMAKHDATLEYYQNLNAYKSYSKLPWVGVHLDELKLEYEFNGEMTPIDQIYESLLGDFNINTVQWELEEAAYNSPKEFSFFLSSRLQGFDWDDLGEHYSDPSDFDYDYKFFFSDEAAALLSADSIKNFQDNYKLGPNDETNKFNFNSLGYIKAMRDVYPDKWKEIYDAWKSGHWIEDFDFLNVDLALRIWAKYFKIKTYFTGTFYEENTNYTKLDKFWMTDYKIDTLCSDDINVLAHPHFFANAQFSGRWSSNFHTIPSRSEVKRCTTSPDDSIFTYFDISSMEVRGIGYLAQDPKLVNLFETHQDVYKFCAKFMLGEEFWNSLEPWEVKDYRTQFKTVLLAYLYWRSAGSLAPELKKTKKETQKIMDSLSKTFPEVIEFRDYLSNYPLKHDGQLLTVFKEWIVSDEEPYRQIKHGINTVIQGATAVMLVFGFYNLMKQAWKRGWKFRSVGYVHDSSQSYFDIKHIFEMSNFYYEHVTKFLYDRFRVNMAFDIMCGCDYYDVCKLTQIDENTLQFQGTGMSLNLIIDRLKRNDIHVEIVNTEELGKNLVDGHLVEDIHYPIDDFIETGSDMAVFKRDHSSYKLVIRKIDEK